MPRFGSFPSPAFFLAAGSIAWASACSPAESVREYGASKSPLVTSIGGQAVPRAALPEAYTPRSFKAKATAANKKPRPSLEERLPPPDPYLFEEARAPEVSATWLDDGRTRLGLTVERPRFFNLDPDTVTPKPGTFSPKKLADAYGEYLSANLTVCKGSDCGSIDGVKLVEMTTVGTGEPADSYGDDPYVVSSRVKFTEPKDGRCQLFAGASRTGRAIYLSPRLSIAYEVTVSGAPTGATVQVPFPGIGDGFAGANPGLAVLEGETPEGPVVCRGGWSGANRPPELGSLVSAKVKSGGEEPKPEPEPAAEEAQPEPAAAVEEPKTEPAVEEAKSEPAVEEAKPEPAAAAPAEEAKTEQAEAAPAEEAKPEQAMAAPAEGAKTEPAEAAPAEEAKAEAAPAEEAKAEAAPAEEAKPEAAPAEEAKAEAATEEAKAEAAPAEEAKPEAAPAEAEAAPAEEAKAEAAPTEEAKPEEPKAETAALKAPGCPSAPAAYTEARAPRFRFVEMAKGGREVTFQVVGPHVFNLDHAAISSGQPEPGYDRMSKNPTSGLQKLLGEMGVFFSRDNLKFRDANGTFVTVKSVALAKVDNQGGTEAEGCLKGAVVSATYSDEGSCAAVRFANEAAYPAAQFFAPEVTATFIATMSYPLSAKPTHIDVKFPGLMDARPKFAGEDGGVALVASEGERSGRKPICAGSDAKNSYRTALEAGR